VKTNSLAQRHGLQPQESGLRAGSAFPAFQELASFDVLYQTTCTYPIFGLSFQEERGSDRDRGVWLCIALSDKNILPLYGITENLNSIPKTFLPSQSFVLLLAS